MSSSLSPGWASTTVFTQSRQGFHTNDTGYNIQSQLWSGLKWFYCGLALPAHWLVVLFCVVMVRVTGRAGGWRVGMKSSVSHYWNRTDGCVFQAGADVEQKKTLSCFLSCKSTPPPFWMWEFWHRWKWRGSIVNIGLSRSNSVYSRSSSAGLYSLP